VVVNGDAVGPENPDRPRKPLWNCTGSLKLWMGSSFGSKLRRFSHFRRRDQEPVVQGLGFQTAAKGELDADQHIAPGPCEEPYDLGLESRELNPNLTFAEFRCRHEK
jgi:hypothetical protein